jgi:hypothetical protein
VSRVLCTLSDHERRADVYCQFGGIGDLESLNMSSLLRTIGAVFVFCMCGLPESTRNLQLLVQVRSEAVLTWQGDGVVLVKARLEPSTQMRLWMDDSCSTPPANGHVIASSGIHTIPFGEMDGLGKVNVCLSSSDGSVRSFLPVLSN